MKRESESVKVERNAAEEPQAVVVRLTVEEAEFVEHMYMVAFGMVCGFLKKCKGQPDRTDTAAIKHGMEAMLADGDTAERVSTLVRAMHSGVHHPGQTCEEQIEGEGEEPEQNWRCN